MFTRTLAPSSLQRIEEKVVDSIPPVLLKSNRSRITSEATVVKLRSELVLGKLELAAGVNTEGNCCSHEGFVGANMSELQCRSAALRPCNSVVQYVHREKSPIYFHVSY